jgi:hypothetical protein
LRSGLELLFCTRALDLAAVPEPFTSILAALAGALAGGVLSTTGNWFDNVSKRDDATTAALIQVSTSVKHIDKTLERFETAFDGIYTALQRHDNRITHLEATREPHL